MRFVNVAINTIERASRHRCASCFANCCPLEDEMKNRNWNQCVTCCASSTCAWSSIMNCLSISSLATGMAAKCRLEIVVFCSESNWKTFLFFKKKYRMVSSLVRQMQNCNECFVLISFVFSKISNLFIEFCYCKSSFRSFGNRRTFLTLRADFRLFINRSIIATRCSYVRFC